MIRLFSAIAALLMTAGSVWAQSTPQSIEVDKVWQLRRPSVVKLVVSGTDAVGSPTPQTTGLGVFVSNNGHIFTALHVVGRDADWQREGNLIGRNINIIGLLPNGTEETLGHASAVQALGNQDAAIISIVARSQPAPVARSLPSGGAWVISVPWRRDSTIPQPVVVQTMPTNRNAFGDSITINEQLEPGQSGAPLFDSEGNLLGIVTTKRSQTEALALPVDLIGNNLAYFSRGEVYSPVAFVPFFPGERVRPLDGFSGRYDKNLGAFVYPEGAKASLSLVCFSDDVGAPRIDRLSVLTEKVPQPPVSEKQTNSIPALGITEVGYLAVTLNGVKTAHAFWRQADGSVNVVRSTGTDANLLETDVPKVIDLNCKQDEKWTILANSSQRAVGMYKIRFVADVFLKQSTYTIRSDPIYIERVVR